MSYRKDKNMWRDRILAAKKEKGISSKTIAEFAQLSEKTVKRMLTDVDYAPFVGNVISIGAAVGLSPQEIFMETGTVVGDQGHAILQAEVARLTNESVELNAEIGQLRSQVSALTVENDLLRLKLEHKEELIKHKDGIILLLSKKEKS